MMRTGRQFKGVRATDLSTPTSTPRFITYKPQGTVRTTPTTSHYEQAATPFHWTFTRQDLANLMARIEGKGRALNIAA